ncbi:MAG TPA: hypothetical protein VKS21_07785, partial [Spirochaetota bacterium]|nr:hypothetical protein [Spirochaetota bacterium]
MMFRSASNNILAIVFLVFILISAVAAQEIYNDANPWDHYYSYSGGGSMFVSNTNTGLAAEGASELLVNDISSLSIGLDRNGAGFPFDASLADTFSFSYRGPTLVSFTVQLQDKSGTTSQTLSFPTSGGNTTSNISVYDLTNGTTIDMSRLERITYTFSGNCGQFYLDDISFNGPGTAVCSNDSTGQTYGSIQSGLANSPDNSTLYELRDCQYSRGGEDWGVEV